MRGISAFVFGEGKIFALIEKLMNSDVTPLPTCEIREDVYITI